MKKRPGLAHFYKKNFSFQRVLREVQRHCAGRLDEPVGLCRKSPRWEGGHLAQQCRNQSDGIRKDFYDLY